MKKSTVKNLVIGTIDLLGIGYIAKTTLKTKKESEKIEDNNIEIEHKPVYHSIGEVIIEDGKPTIKSLAKK